MPKCQKLIAKGVDPHDSHVKMPQFRAEKYKFTAQLKKQNTFGLVRSVFHNICEAVNSLV